MTTLISVILRLALLLPVHGGAYDAAGRRELRERARELFTFGYDNYMRHAFPLDELNPIDCEGRGPDYDNPENININDVLGNYSLTLVDSLDTLAVFGNRSEFNRAIGLVITHVSFDQDTNVQVFEVAIRVLGALLSAHVIARDGLYGMAGAVSKEDANELLSMAHDLGTRLLPAFESTKTGIPHPRVNLRHGLLLAQSANRTCLAGAGTLLLEFGMLSRLLGDPTFEGVAHRALMALWKRRSTTTGLLGNEIDIQSGEWLNTQSGLGAGMDSFYEYLLKASIFLGKDEYFSMFMQAYASIEKYMLQGEPPLYVNVDMRNGALSNFWIDSLQASFAGLQVLLGDVKGAIQSHTVYFSLWQKFGGLPERFNWKIRKSEIHFYPLRPELIESTYLLHRATRDPYFVQVGEVILNDLSKHARSMCGFATLHDVGDKSHEDRMESYFLSETCKYLFLLFDDDNALHQSNASHVFTTQAHVFPLDKIQNECPRPRKRGYLRASDSGPDATIRIQRRSFPPHAIEPWHRDICPVWNQPPRFHRHAVDSDMELLVRTALGT